MAQVTEQQILDALKEVLDPDHGTDIVSLGMVTGIIIKDGNIGFAIEVDAERGQQLEPMRKQAEKTVAELPGVLSVSAVLTADRAAANAPAGTSPGPAGEQAGPARAGGISPPGVQHIVAVASGKGGVGKSTTASNIALGLAAKGLRVGMLDADIYGPSQPRLLGITGQLEVSDADKLEPLDSHGIKVMSIGFLVPEDTPMIWRGPMVTSALQQMLREIEWGELDIMVVDMPPGTGDAQLTMAQQVPLAGAVIISTPQDIALLDARKGLNMFRKVDVPVLGFIENMSYYVCPKCGDRADIFGHGGAKDEAEKLETEFLGEIPLDIAIRETSDQGHPIVISQPDTVHAAAYLKIADRIWQKLTEEIETSKRTAPKIVVQ
jgi:ATP-binding protein involved in chromosome partitioning